MCRHIALIESLIMKLTLHHINLASENVERMEVFYRDVLGCKAVTGALPVLEKRKGYAGDVAFAGVKADSEEIQFHLAHKDIYAGFNSGQTVNPVSHGHIAFRTDDLAAFKDHLESLGVPYSDWGNKAVETWHQIFFYDPDGNVIEVHQIDDAK